MLKETKTATKTTSRDTNSCREYPSAVRLSVTSYEDLTDQKKDLTLQRRKLVQEIDRIDTDLIEVTEELRRRDKKKSVERNFPR